MKKFFLSPLVAPVFVMVFISVVFWVGVFFPTLNYYDNKDILEYVTYAFYALPLIGALVFWGDFSAPGKRRDYFLFLFLWVCALAREAGVQHVLTSTDTTAFKLRFFTNPDNPLHEKLISGFLLLMVFCVVCYLLCCFIKKIWNGFWALDPMYWTICSLGVTGIVSKFADRFPSNYFKMTGRYLAPDIDRVVYLVEEGGEATLPVICLIALIQWHYRARTKK